MQHKTSEKVVLLFILLVFTSIFVSISFVNHYLFRTHALDLGMFNHALYNFAHFQKNYFTLSIVGAEVNYFGDHFSPITLLYAPFYYLFGSYTLLIIQIGAIIFGGLGIKKIAEYYLDNKYLSFLILIHFFGIWGIYSALSFDFHNNVIASMLIPWFVYYWINKNKRMSVLFFILILLTKENMAIWMSFIILGLMLGEKGVNIKNAIKFEIPLLLFSFFYFILIIGFVMPYLSGGEGTNQIARYGNLGSSLTEIIRTILFNPKMIFTMLFESSIQGKMYVGIKSELHFMILVSGGFTFFRKPVYLLMLAPIYLQKLLTDNFGFWGINIQYSIEFVPIISLGLISILRLNFKLYQKYALIILTILMTYFATYSTIEKRKSLWYSKESKTKTIFYSKDHYSTPLDVSAIYKALDNILEQEIISVSSALAPHLAFRDKIYLFPNIKDASHIILLSENSTTYPLNKEDFSMKIEALKSNENYKVIVDTNSILIFEKQISEHDSYP